MSKFLKIVGAVLIVVAALIATFVSQEFPKRSGHSISESNSTLKGDSGMMNPLSANPIGSQNMMRGETKLVAPSTDMGMPYTSSPDLPQTDEKIIKSGNLDLKVDNADQALNQIRGIAKMNGGEIFSSNFYQTGDRTKSGIVTVKVPVVAFEKTFAEIKKSATLVLQESTAGQDVTEQYVDLQAQLSNALAEEQSFMKILNKAEKIDDVLAVTRELSRVRGTIEQLQGRMKYLASQTDMSTITVTLTENQNIGITNSWQPIQVIKDSVNSLLKGLRGFVDFLIGFFIVTLPFILIWGMIIWLLYRLGKKIYTRMKENNDTSN